MPEQKVMYRAISIFTSRTFYFNVLAAIVAFLALPEVTHVIPSKFMPYILAISAAGNMILRTMTVRPAAFISPGSTKAIAVRRIGPPEPSKVTD
jgi:hypothetical protein